MGEPLGGGRRLVHFLQLLPGPQIAPRSPEISFSDFTVLAGRPKAFVVMQFAEPYDTFYREVIQSEAGAAGFDVVRIDEKAGPGIIFQDIQ